MIENIEFYTFQNELWCMFSDGTNKIVSESDVDLIKSVLERIREFYPKAYDALSECYKKSSLNVPYYQYLMVRRFCKCNFGNLDDTKVDIDLYGRFQFECVSCPLRGECKYEGIICGAEFNNVLSKSETRVMKLLYEGISKEDIASKLYLSPETVKNHIKSSYKKLGVHERSEFVRYAHDNNLFDNL